MRFPLKALYTAVASFSVGLGLYDYRFDHNQPEKRTEIYLLTERDFVNVLSEYSIIHNHIPQENFDLSKGECVSGLTFTGERRVEIYDKLQRRDKLITIPHELVHAYFNLVGFHELNTQSNDSDVERKAQKIYHQVYGGK